MHGLRPNSALLCAPGETGGRPPLLIFSPRLALGTAEKARVHSTAANFWAAEKAWVRQPLLIPSRSLVLGIPKNAGVT